MTSPGSAAIRPCLTAHAEAVKDPRGCRIPRVDTADDAVQPELLAGNAGLVLRPDWENVVTPVLDYALSRPDVDPARVALIGLSLGAHLAPRAASAEHRLAACIADCGSYDLFASALERIPGPLATGLAQGRSLPTAVLRRILRALAAKPTAISASAPSSLRR